MKSVTTLADKILMEMRIRQNQIDLNIFFSFLITLISIIAYNETFLIDNF